MNAIGKAVWFIEGHLGGEITLDDIAAAGGLSRFHMSRAFGQAFNRPVMRYVWGRRLSRAAQALADGAPDILSVALEAGYGSHEAFTRAFRDQFGVTPEKVRQGVRIEPQKLVEPIPMEQKVSRTLEPQRFVDGKAMLVAGLGGRFDYDNADGIPALWERFNRHVGSIPGEVPGAAYGVCTSSDGEGFDYICAVEVKDLSDVDPEFTRLRIEPQRYAVFRHSAHISSIKDTMNGIWSDWLPRSGMEPAHAPTLEKYGREFNPDTGYGGLEVWFAVKR